MKIGKDMDDKPTRPARTDFPTQGLKDLKLKVHPKLKANERSSPTWDNWTGVVSFINVSKGEDKESISMSTIHSMISFIHN